MKKYAGEKYWEKEEPQTIEFGYSFIRYFHKAKKIQFGKVPYGNHVVKYVLDVEDMDDEALRFLMFVLKKQFDERKAEGDD